MIEEKYRTFWRRLLAGWIDGLLFYPLSIIDKAVLNSAFSQFIIGSWVIFDYWAFIIYNLMMLTWRGQTVGKMLCRVKVTDVTGAPMNFKQAVLRDLPIIIINICYMPWIFRDLELFRQIKKGTALATAPASVWIVTAVTLSWFVLEFVTMLFSHKRRAVHDFIAGTVVTKNA